MVDNVNCLLRTTEWPTGTARAWAITVEPGVPYKGTTSRERPGETAKTSVVWMAGSRPPWTHWVVTRARVSISSIIFDFNLNHVWSVCMQFVPWIYTFLCLVFFRIYFNITHSMVVITIFIPSQREHDAMITSLLRWNDVATSFWRNNDVIVASHFRGFLFFRHRAMCWSPVRCSSTTKVFLSWVLCYIVCIACNSNIYIYVFLKKIRRR